MTVQEIAVKWIKSHPTGVRGLKSQPCVAALAFRGVAPHWGAWIEIHVPFGSEAGEGRTPLGCVD